MKISIKKYAEALVESLADEKDKKKVGEKINNLLKILAKRKQSKLIRQLSQEFKTVWMKKKGQLEVLVTLPYKPSDEEKLRIIRSLGEALKKEIIMGIKVDEKVIGGMKIEFEDYIIDGTVAKSLEMLKLNLINTN
jgi:ATP synthase F1 delta subunit